MNGPANNEASETRPASLPRACALFAALLAAIFPCFAGYGYATHGLTGIFAGFVAFCICLASGLAALCIAAIAQKVNQGVQGVLGAMLVRMSVPLVALFVLPKIGGPLVAAGVTGMVMAYYLFTLAIETWLSLRFVPANKISGAKSPAAKVA